MAVQPEVKNKTLLETALDLADDTFTRITAGISAGECRKMLRGEPAGKPNPRLKPHSEAFLLHIKPTYYHESVTRFTHTFRLGLLSTYLFFVETITGIQVRERIPDRVIDDADEVELVDMSPQALRQRMKHGNVYPLGTRGHRLVLQHGVSCDGGATVRDAITHFDPATGHDRVVAELPENEAYCPVLAYGERRVPLG